VSRSSRTFLVTGVTGFLGKVLLEELVRRQHELGVERVGVIIRPLRGLGAQERFRREVARAECFSRLPADWSRIVTVIEGTLETPGLGMSADHSAFLNSVTHIVHAAASVKFDLPVADAARSNVTPTVNMLELARTLPALQRFVYVSTGYVSLNPEGTPIDELLSPLHAPASELYGACIYGGSESTLLAVTGHPNTYTLTKSIAEHLLVERRGDVPLTIVRPSIITASRAYPFPGWIDSTAGFAAFVMLIAAGHLRAVVSRSDARLDLIPVDEVTERIVRAALEDSQPTAIRHAVTGATNSPTMRQAWDTIQRFFRVHRVGDRPRGRYLGPDGTRFKINDFVQHRLPLAMSGLRSKGAKRQAEKRAARLTYLNTEFAYFTTRTFDFRSSLPFSNHSTNGKHVHTVCRGIYRHLLKRDEAEWVLVGRAHAGHGGDLRWVARQPRGNLWIRWAAWIVTKVLRRSVERVTVDIPSFDRALGAIPNGATLVLTPSHRSYLDFVLTAYLAFARPDLFPIPHFAATIEFARVPILGRILESMHAFYLRRGQGKDPELAARVTSLMNDGHTLAFFIEGQRSRSGQFLPPKRGLLRCLQASGRQTAMLPIAIAYDRVPEQPAFERELAGHAKPTMRLGALLSWGIDAWRGRVDLGRIHIACGAPVTLDATSDVHAVSQEIVEHLRVTMATTTPAAAPGLAVQDLAPAGAANRDLLAGAISAR
jgi:alcohol-forming fatty acyl-CoA reductase